MKNIFLGAICLVLFAISFTLIEVSCQKIGAQASRQASPSSGGLVLYSKTSIYQIIPFTHTDSVGNTITDRIDTLYTQDFYTCNVDGSNSKQIPIVLPAGLVAGQPKFVSNGTAIVFSVGSAAVVVNGELANGSIDGNGIYTCALDGSGLKRIVATTSGITGSVNTDDGY